MSNIEAKIRRDFRQKLRELLALKAQFTDLLSSLEDATFSVALLSDPRLALGLMALTVGNTDPVGAEKPDLAAIILDSALLEADGVPTDAEIEALLDQLIPLAKASLREILAANGSEA